MPSIEDSADSEDSHLNTEQNTNQFGTSSSEGTGTTASPYEYDYDSGEAYGLSFGTVLITTAIVSTVISTLLILAYHYLIKSFLNNKNNEDDKDDDSQGGSSGGHGTDSLPNGFKGELAEFVKRAVRHEINDAFDKKMPGVLKETLKENEFGNRQPQQSVESVEIVRNNISTHDDSNDSQDYPTKRNDLTSVTTIDNEMAEIFTKYCAAEKGSGTDREDFLIEHKNLYSGRMYDFGLKSPDDSYDRNDYSFREFIKNPSSPSMILFLLRDGEIGLILPRFKQASRGSNSFTKDGCHKFFKVDSWNGLSHLIQPAIVKFSPCKTIIESIEQYGKIG
jgi:hypothetical protein